MFCHQSRRKVEEFFLFSTKLLTKTTVDLAPPTCAISYLLFLYIPGVDIVYLISDNSMCRLSQNDTCTHKIGKHTSLEMLCSEIHIPKCFLICMDVILVSLSDVMAFKYSSLACMLIGTSNTLIIIIHTSVLGPLQEKLSVYPFIGVPEFCIDADTRFTPSVPVITVSHICPCNLHSGCLRWPVCFPWILACNYLQFLFCPALPVTWVLPWVTNFTNRPQNLNHNIHCFITFIYI